jgi:hypothetical protein
MLQTSRLTPDIPHTTFTKFKAEMMAMKERGIWTLDVSKKTDLNVLSKRKLSLKNITTEKKIIKLKGIDEERLKMLKNKESNPTSRKVTPRHNSMKSLRQ